MRATKRSITAAFGTVAAFAGATLLMGGPASAVQTPAAPAAVSAQSDRGTAAEGFASAIEDAKAEAGSNVLRPGEALREGEAVLSGNGKYGVAQLEDGNLVFGRVQDQKVLFATYTHDNPGAATRMNEDGNLVVYDTETKEPLWASNTTGNPNAWLQVQDDGELAIFGQDGKHKWTDDNWIARMGIGPRLDAGKWISSTNREYHLLMQDAGNLVLYDKNRQPLWGNDTTGVKGAYATLQGDGNLVIIDPSTDKAVWASNTAGEGGTTLQVGNDGNVTIQNEDGEAVWATNTAR